MVCNKIKPRFDSMLVVEPDKIYWIIKSGSPKTIVCAKSRSMRENINTGMLNNKQQ
jgi:hypothetical protein